MPMAECDGDQTGGISNISSGEREVESPEFGFLKKDETLLKSK